MIKKWWWEQDLNLQPSGYKTENAVEYIHTHMRLRLTQSAVKQYIDLKDRALEACDYQTSLRALNQLAKHLKIFEHYHAAPLLEAIEKNPDGLEELVDQFLWINTSLGNWSFVLRALELKVKLAGKEKGELNYEEMLNSLELAS